MIKTLLLGVTSFAGTNIDDLFINTLLFAGAKNKADQRSILLGKYLGIGILVLLSILGASGLRLLAPQYIGMLGLVPLALGTKEIISALRSKDIDADSKPDAKSSNLLLNTALITVANGADNLGIYIPLFASFAPWQTALTLLVFSVLIWVWCYLGKRLASLPALKDALARYKQTLVPIVYIALGVYILAKNFHL